MANAPSCTLPSTARAFGRNVVTKLSPEQRKKYGVTDDNMEASSLALADIALWFTHDETKRHLLEKPRDFANLLEELMVSKISKGKFDEVFKAYKELAGNFGGQRLVAMNNFGEDDPEELLKDCMDYEHLGIAKVTASRENGKITLITMAILEPQLVDKTPQEMVLDRLNAIHQLSSKFGDVEISILDSSGKPITMFVKGWEAKDREDEGWTRTGRTRYTYNGKTIIATGVTYDGKPYEGAVAAGPIGTNVDKVGRLYFDRHTIAIKNNRNKEETRFIKLGEAIPDGWSRESEYSIWKADGTLDLSDENLEDIISNHLGGIFTVQGLRNLIKDFQTLEAELKEALHDDNVLFFSQEMKLFGKQGDNWTVGVPDLIAIDSKGKLHVIDFKTKKISSLDNYTDLDSRDISKYSNQVSNYIGILSAYGFDVDLQPRIVRIDTFYDGTDTIAERKTKASKGYKYDRKTGEVYDNEGNLVTTDGETIVFKVADGDKKREIPKGIWIVDEGKEKTLGQYSEEQGNPGREDALESGKKLLYIEPRLHVKGYNEKTGFSEELGALLGEEEGIKFQEVSYEQQWQALTTQEKSILQDLGAQPIKRRPAPSGIVTLSSSDIDSNPRLIGSQEIQAVADNLMYKVSKVITEIQNGTLGEGELLGIKTSHLKGLDRKAIVKRVGINNLIDYAFKVIEAKYQRNLPIYDTEKDFKNAIENGDIDEDDFSSYKDYLEQRRFSEKAQWLMDSKHKEQLIERGINRLMALEDYIVVSKNPNTTSTSTPSGRLTIDESPVEDNGDNAAFENFMDRYLEGIVSLEGWQIEARNRSNKSSLARELLRMFETIIPIKEIRKASNGKETVITEKDPYGWGFDAHLDSTQAMQAVLDTLKDCEDIESMMDALQAFAVKNTWANQVIQKLNSDESLKTKFFRNFRKDFTIYSIGQYTFDKESGNKVVVTRVINLKSAYDALVQTLGASYRSGKVGNITIGKDEYSLLETDSSGQGLRLTRYGTSTVFAKLQSYIKTCKANVASIYNSAEYKNISNTEKQKKREYVLKHLTEDKFECPWDHVNRTTIEAIANLLEAIGLENVPESAILNHVSKTLIGATQNNANLLLSSISSILNKLEEQIRNDGSVPSSLAGNNASPKYFPLIKSLSDNVFENIEASVYQDGKTYYSFVYPSKTGTIIRNLKGAASRKGGFDRYLDRNFGRYSGWFKSNEDGEWLCDWLYMLAENKDSARTALQHKAELSYIGNPYKNLGALGFQLSILHNYFGSKDDNTLNKNWRWFALPTMSNKNTNEFIRMLKYGNSSNYKDVIVERVLMKTFQQEVNRMADVLFHYTHHNVGIDKMDIEDKPLKSIYEAKVREQHKGENLDKEQISKLVQGEIDALKKRIDSHTITADDLVDLGKITSGAKFHFLWYLNDEMASNRKLAEDIAYKINLLLTEDSAEKEKNTDANRLIGIAENVEKAIRKNMDIVAAKELDNMEAIGLFEKITRKTKDGGSVEVLKYQEQFGGKLGKGEDQMRSLLTEFIWQDIAANINIIQITGGDLAYYGNAVNYQKRIAMVHSPGLQLMNNEKYTDGYLRSVHISDMKVREEIAPNVEVALTGYMDDAVSKGRMSSSQAEDYRKMIRHITSQISRTDATDGQSYNSPSSIRKKLRLQGKWNDEQEQAYQKICKGDFNINNLQVMLNPEKPLVRSMMAKYSGSPSMKLRQVPLQDKNSEYLLILAEAVARGSGQQSKLVAICDFMELTHRNNSKVGIDTVHFESVNKVGKSGVIDIAAFDKEFQQRLDAKENGLTKADYNRELTKYLVRHINPYDTKSPVGSVQTKAEFDGIQAQVGEGGLDIEETIYNPVYVDTIPLEDYIVQQEVPVHRFEDQQLYGSQIRILGISDITPGTEFDVNGEKLKDKALIDEYKHLHAENIYDAYNELFEELGLDSVEAFRKAKVKSFDAYIKDRNLPMETQPQREAAQNSYDAYVQDTAIKSIVDLPRGTEIREKFFKNVEYLLRKELRKDSRYSSDVRKACTLRYDSNGYIIDFTVPLSDPIQSKRIQMLFNSIIKKKINKLKINGASVVQTASYDRDLHIRFKNSKGDILPTFDEYRTKHKSLSEKEAIAAYKKFLQEEQAGVAYFECYAPVPNEQIERLITKPDGSRMSVEELRSKNPKLWESLSQMIGYRIPTEDKYSMIPLKIVGFMPKAAGQTIMMPQEITFLTGSDFDIDKIYLMIKSIDIDMMDYSLDSNKDSLQMIVDEFVKTVRGGKYPAGINNIAKQVALNAYRILTNDPIYSWYTGLTTLASTTKDQELIEQFIEFFRDYTLRYANEVKKENGAHRKARVNARNNRILDLQWAVLTNKDTLPKMLNPGNFDEQKTVGRIIRVIKSGIANPATGARFTWEELRSKSIDELDALLQGGDSHNTTLPSSKIYFQHQNMQGSQMVGIFANHNVSHAFCSFQRIGIDLSKGLTNYSFSFNGHVIGNSENESDITTLDNIWGFNGKLISKTIASFLAASVDTAKDPTLADMNVNTFTGGVAMLLARLGFDTEAIGLFLSQPIIVELSELYFRNSTEGYFDGNTAIKQLCSEYKIDMEKNGIRNSEGIEDDVLNVGNFVKHLNDSLEALKEDNNKDDNFQVRVLKGFYRLFEMSKDLQNLTFCTKFNSVNNAVGPTIADTEEDLAKVKNFTDNIKDSCFYVPEDDSDFTNPAKVIENDPILKAFFTTTVDDSEDAVDGKPGASKAIFREFFPHYYVGFQNVLERFKDEFTSNGKLSSKLYNQLLDDYIYYLLTYQDDDFLPTIPSSRDDKFYLVNGLVERYNEVQQIKGVRPNMLLNPAIGGTTLRVRKADDFIAQDILIFNGAQLDAQGQQAVKDAWSDLITMNDPNLSDDDNDKIRRFGVDLFFYTLMRNGFGFSPRTLMHLASVIVRYNAWFGQSGFSRYIDGLSNVKAIDKHLNGMSFTDDKYITRFINQFIRNHANNNQLVKNFDGSDPLILGEITDAGVVTGIVLDAKEDYMLDSVMILNKPRHYIKVTSKLANGNLTQTLYELESMGENTLFSEGGMTKIRYRKVNRLGLVNNFIEYAANDDLPISFFEDMTDGSDASLEEETDSNTAHDNRQTGAQSEEDRGDVVQLVKDPEWQSYRKAIIEFYKGGEHGENPLNGQLRTVGEMFVNYKATGESPLKAQFDALKKGLSIATINEIAEILKKENSCN